MRTLFFTFFVFVTLALSAQKNTDPVLLKIDDEVVTRSEFEAIFKKNNRDSVITKADLDEYLELFINFKLKVKAAEELGMDTMPQFKRELAGYREQLSKPYLADKAMTDSLVMEAFNRMKSEVKASHILIKLDPDPSPEDTAAAYKEIMALKKQLDRDGSDFDSMAKLKSQDPSAKQNSGNLGYFTALQMVYPFENIVYKTPVGKVGGPVRTQYGYHLVKVTDKRDARGQVRVAHIMILAEEGDPEDLAATNKRRADELYERLENGEDFVELAKKFSDDRSSSAKGGELPAFGSSKMVAEFEEAAFDLKEVGELSKPIKSPYGWHIIKLLERIPPQPYKEVEKELSNKIARDSRSNVSKESFIAKRKAEYGFKEDRSELKPFYAALDTSYYSGRWQPSSKLEKSNKVLFTLDKKEFRQSDFLSFLQSRMRARRSVVPIKTMVNDSYSTYVEREVMDYENSRLEQKYPEFKALVNEYRDGILLFDLTDQKVWSKAVKDSAGLAAYYTTNQNDFMWEERAGYDMYTLEKAEDGKLVKKMLKKGKNPDEIQAALNGDNVLRVRVESGLKEKEEVPAFQLITWEKGISDVVEDNGQFKILNIKEIRKPEPKDFDETRGLVTAAYQNQLEQEWIESLRSKHTVEANKDVLYTIK